MSKILLVDDDEMFRLAVLETLMNANHQVTCASNGRQAVQLFEEGRYDLVISDIQMPEMDGVELTKAIRCNSRIPIILMTGFSSLVEATEAYQAGANEFLPKPFEGQDLLKAIERCSKHEEKSVDSEDEYCKIGINDFITGRIIKFSIYVRLGPKRYLKLAHKGEDLSLDRVHYYRSKGLSYLYLKREDFRQYVGFSVSLSNIARTAKSINIEKKLKLLRHTGEVLSEQIRQNGVDGPIFEAATAFVGATINIVSDNVGALDLLDALRSDADDLLVHSVGVSLYSIMIAQHLDWNLPMNRFKLAMGGLFHDVGMKELDSEQLARPRYNWTVDEVKKYESHPLRSLAILSTINDIPEDVREIIKHHHENALSKGFPAAVKKNAIHPMAKVVAVADEFCYRTVKGSQAVEMSPLEAIHDMRINCGQLLDKKSFEALGRLFNIELS